jgi:glutamate-ammonia-ligase adenylyltransferase
VFLHDCDQPEVETQGGPRPITASAFFTRLGQRLVHWVSTLTPAGRAYEVDLELRPSGRSGLPVVSFRGFEDYQRHHAWTWEHQALTRARFVAGAPLIGDKFERLRLDLLCLERDRDSLRREVLEMRAKMRAQFDRPDPQGWHIKHSAGGLIDIEFITQYLLLREASAHPSVARWSDNWRQLEALSEAGVLQPEVAQRLIITYRAYRAWAHSAALMQREPRVDHESFAAERAEVESLWARVFELGGPLQ